MDQVQRAWQRNSIEKSADFTADLHGVYLITATLTVTDPTPAQGHEYICIVRNGTATIGGSAFIAGQVIWRTYHSGAWSNTVEASLGTAQTFSALQTFIAGLTVSAGTTALQATTCTSLTNSGLTSGRVVRAGTAGLLSDSANFLDDGSTKVTVGYATASTSTTTGALVVSGGVGVAGAINAGGTITVDTGSGSVSGYTPIGRLRVIGGDGVNAGADYVAFGTGSDFSAFRTAGTRASPSATLDNSSILGIASYAWDGSAWGVGCALNFRADGTQSGSNHGGYYQFRGTSNGSTTLNEWLTIRNGIVTVSQNIASTSTTTGALVVSGGVGVAGGLWVGGQYGIKVRSVTSAAGTTTLDDTDYCAICTGTTTQTFTLPGCSTGRTLIIKNRSTGTLTVNRAGSDTIDGVTTISLTANQSAILVGNTADWTVN